MRLLRGVLRWSHSRSAAVFAWMVVVLAGLFGGPAVAWHLRRAADVDLLIVDKTVPLPNYREHEGLTWILRHRKIHHPAGSREVQILDYAGYHPERPEPVTPITPKPRSLDFAYVADTYGVYEDDLGVSHPDGERSQLIYGGLRTPEVSAIVGAMRPGGTLVAEFNSLASPTQGAAREAFGRAVGVRWTGWIGRHYDSLVLGPDLPAWLPRLHRKNTGYPWRYRGSGYVFVSEKEELVVLIEGIDIERPGVEIVFTEDSQRRYGVPERHVYDYWFDIVEPVGRTTVLAHYELDLRRRGRRLMAAAGIPSRMPAMLRRDGPGHVGYYLAGDLADLAGVGAAYRYAGLPMIRRAVVDNARDDQTGFFWNVYEPFMSRVLSDVVGVVDRRTPSAWTRFTPGPQTR